MKRIAILLLLLLSAFIFGWMLGYLNIPLAIRSTSFWMGFAVALVFITLIILLINFIFSKDKRLLKMPNVLFILVLIALTILLFFGNQSIKNLNESEREAQNLKSQFSRKLDELKNSSAVQQQQLFKVAFERLQKEIKIGNGKLSENAIQSIVSFSASLKPYHLEHIDDSLLLSPERGLLLMGICQLEMDTNSFNTLIRKVDFSYADLRGVQFSDLNLEGISLQKANFNDSKLMNVDFDNAQLEGTDFSFSEIKMCVFNRADMGDVIFNWATISNSDIRNAELNAMNTSSANFTNVNFSTSNLKWSQIHETYIEHCNFDSTDLMSANFVESILQSSTFNHCRLRKSSWKNTKISNSDMDFVAVEDNWFNDVDSSQINGIDHIKSTYKIVADSSQLFQNDFYYLKQR